MVTEDGLWFQATLSRSALPRAVTSGSAIDCEAHFASAAVRPPRSLGLSPPATLGPVLRSVGSKERYTGRRIDGSADEELSDALTPEDDAVRV